jgi:hypothetical protein
VESATAPALRQKRYKRIVTTALLIVGGFALIVFSGGLARYAIRRNDPRLLNLWPGGTEGARKFNRAVVLLIGCGWAYGGIARLLD